MKNTVTNNSLLILQFNATDLENHINELQSVLYNRRIDIAIIIESHFTKYSHFHIPGFHLIKTNYPDNTSHGEVAVLIKTSLVFQPLPEYCHAYIQSCSIIMKLNNIPIAIRAFLSPLVILLSKLTIILVQLKTTSLSVGILMPNTKTGSTVLITLVV